MQVTEGAVRRELATCRLAADLAVVGGGLSGVCCAIAAARAGVRVVLVQDRPVLGGNSSSEVRLWALGATSHMGNNNRWAREGGVIDELLVENLYRNPEGNPLIFDALLLEKVVGEPNITLLLNTAVHDLDKSDGETIRSIRAFCPQNETVYEIAAPLFCDASGDGIVGFMAGAVFRVGAEGRAEFDEGFAPPEPSGELLGHTIYFYSKDTGRPVRFVPPAFALADIRRIPRWRDIGAGDFGCRFWWLEWGGKLDTVHDTEKIKWELWKVVYGVWNHIKNSGQFPEAANLTLEWVGTVPGKRESRRFEGEYVLSQKDIIEQRRQRDAVAFGGWAIDLHPAEGVYSPKSPCVQWHSKGVYQIPYRCLYSRNIRNLFIAGRLISASHVAFGSTRVMSTGACMGQAVGVAAAQKRLPGAVDVQQLQRDLLRSGHFVPGVVLQDPDDLARSARITASSELRLEVLEPDGGTMALAHPWAMMVPVRPGRIPAARLWLDVASSTTLRAELRVSSRPDNHTPDVTLGVRELSLGPGSRQQVELDFGAVADVPRYAFICLMANEAVAVHLSERRLTGLLALTYGANRAVAKSATQSPPPGSGLETFEFWIPQRRPGGKNLAISFDRPLEVFGAENVANGIARPTNQPNAWVAAFDDAEPVLRLGWDTPQEIGLVVLGFDTDYDHPMESLQMGHPERVMPFCVRQYRVLDGSGRELAACADNHQSRNVITFAEPVRTRELAIACAHPGGLIPASLFEVRVYSPSEIPGVVPGQKIAL